MAIVRQVQPKPKPLPKKKRVAAYARVSMESENLLHSFANQVSTYNTLLHSRSDWECAGVYTDKGISGTSTAHRSGFQKLVADCEAGKIDLVITKSISRFARNTVDLLSTIRHLKEIGVEVYFEEQKISTMTSDGELLLTLLASVAQAESESISENVKWSVKKKFEKGLPHTCKRMLGYEWDGEKYFVIEEEAEIVRRIFQSYMDGASPVQIAKMLNADGIRSCLGNDFSDVAVRFILDNEDYTGDLILQKMYSPSIGKRGRNHGQVPKYRVENAHEPIISREDFETVRRMRREKAEAMPEKNVTCFSGLLTCGYCGYSVCRRNVVSDHSGEPCWVCNLVEKNSVDSCECSRRLLESELIKATEAVVGKDYEDTIRRKIERITVYDDRLEFRFRDGKEKTWKREFTGLRRGCFSGKIFCATCGEKYWKYSKKSINYNAWACKNRKNCHAPIIREEELRMAAKDVIGDTDNYEMDFFQQTEKVLIFNDHFDFYLKNGEVRVWQRK